MTSVQVQPFDLPLIVTIEALGGILKTQIEDWDVMVHLPVSGDAGVDGPSAVGDRNVDALLTEGVWGQRLGDFALIHGLIVSVDLGRQEVPDDVVEAGSASADVLDDLASAIDRWVNVWLRWCGALAAQPVDLSSPGTAAPSPRRHMAGRWLLLNGERFVLQRSPTAIAIQSPSRG